MRTFEWILLGLNLLALLGILIPRQLRPRAQAFIPSVGFVAMIVHLLFEGYRWQMMPSYLLALILVTFSIPNLMGGYSKEKASLGMRSVALISMFFGLVLWAGAALPPYLLPVFDLPTPTGQFAVGTTSFHLVDEAREEDLTPVSGDKRALMVSAWYPADADHVARAGSPVPYLERANVTGSILSRALRLPSYTFTYLGLVKTHAYYNVQAAQGSFPVIVFSHAYMPGFGRQNTIQMEALASHGYVVLAIHHPYESAAVLFPDQGVVPGVTERMRDIADERNLARQQFFAYLQAPPEAKLDTARAYFAVLPLLRGTLDRWTEDVFFVTKRLSDINNGTLSTVQWRPGKSSTVDGDNPLTGKLDTTRMGIFGMEMGGMVAAQVCLVSETFQAGLNYDGIQFGDVTDLQRNTPFMVLYGKNTSGNNDPLVEAAFEPSYSGTVANASLYNFNDFSVVSKFFQTMEFLGEIEGPVMSRLLSDVTVKYFDHHVKNASNTSFQFSDPNLEIKRLDP